MASKKVKRSETITAKYGEDKILDNKKHPVPERELWSAVILQALINIHYKNKKWMDDLIFISGGENWDWVCEQLGIDEKRTSKLALMAAINLPDNFRIHNNDSKGEKG